MCDSKAINLSYLINAISRVVLLDTPREGHDKVSAGLARSHRKGLIRSGQWLHLGQVCSLELIRAEQAVSVFSEQERSHVSCIRTSSEHIDVS